MNHDITEYESDNDHEEQEMMEQFLGKRPQSESSQLNTQELLMEFEGKPNQKRVKP